MIGDWESRMAVRTAARRAAMPCAGHWRSGPVPMWEYDHRRPAIGSAVPSMTLGDATQRLRGEPIVCACSGGPMCCFYAYPQAERLRHAAHVTVHLFADLAERKAR